MALSTIMQQRDQIDVPNDEGGTTALPLYGIRGTDIAFLAQEFGPTFSSIYVAAITGKINLDNVEGAIYQVLEEAPMLAAAVIAHGAREPEAIEAALDLPVGVQLEALEKIMRLTFAGESSPKKAWEIVRGVVTAIQGSLQSRPASESGSTNTGSTSAS